jgi:hypothetical protein
MRWAFVVISGLLQFDGLMLAWALSLRVVGEDERWARLDFSMVFVLLVQRWRKNRRHS